MKTEQGKDRKRGKARKDRKPDTIRGPQAATQAGKAGKQPASGDRVKARRKPDKGKESPQAISSTQDAVERKESRLKRVTRESKAAARQAGKPAASDAARLAVSAAAARR